MIIRVLNLETSDLYKEGGRVVEWATVDLVTGWMRGGSGQGLVNPGHPIKPEASAIHHLVDEDVKDAPDWAESLKLITAPPTPDFWCAHNNRFDQKWFNPTGSKWIDTYRCALALWPEAPAHSNQVLRYHFKLRLKDAPVPLVPHRALSDAYVTAELLHHMLTIPQIKISDLLAWSSVPAMLPRFAFGKHAKQPIAEVPSGYLDWVLSHITDDEDVTHTAHSELNRRRAA
jgi:exodeoxyribonuclease X